MALIDNESIRKEPDEGQSLADGTFPKSMGVSEVFTVELPKDMTDVTLPLMFSFDEGSKVKRHSHPKSGSYFVTSGSLKVTTPTECKTYEKGDFVIVPEHVEYDLEAVGGGAEVFYVYYEPEMPLGMPTSEPAFKPKPPSEPSISPSNPPSSA